jgi:hypothetical protein
MRVREAVDVSSRLEALALLEGERITHDTFLTLGRDVAHVRSAFPGRSREKWALR